MLRFFKPVNDSVNEPTAKSSNSLLGVLGWNNPGQALRNSLRKATELVPLIMTQPIAQAYAVSCFYFQNASETSFDYFRCVGDQENNLMNLINSTCGEIIRIAECATYFRPYKTGYGSGLIGGDACIYSSYQPVNPCVNDILINNVQDGFGSEEDGVFTVFMSVIGVVTVGAATLGIIAGGMTLFNNKKNSETPQTEEAKQVDDDHIVIEPNSSSSSVKLSETSPHFSM